MAKDLKILEVVSAGNLILDESQRDTRENYFSEAIGARNVGDAFILSKDFGTKALVSTPPMRPNAFLTITNATNASPIVISTAVTDQLANGHTVYISEVTGNTAANGVWTVANVVSNTSFELVGSTGNGAYVSGGIWQSNNTDTPRPPITIHRAFIFRDKDSGLEYPVVIGIDSSSNTRVYVYDSASSTLDSSYNGSYWIELTRFFTAAINEGAGIGASDTNFDFDTLQENGVNYTGANDFVNNWIVVNTTQSNETVFITDSTASNLVVDTVVGSNGLGWANNDVIQIYRMPCFKFNWTASNGTSPHVDFHFVEDQRKLNILYTDSSTIPVARQAIQLMRRNERNYFYTAFGGSAQRTLPAGWYCESEFGILNPYFTQEGTIQSPYTTFDGNSHSVTNATNATPIVVTLSSVVGLSNGDVVSIRDVTGNTAANGVWTLANSSGSTFELANSVGNGAFVGAGQLQKIVTNNIYDKTSGRQWLNVYTAKTTGGIATTLDKDLRLYVTIGYSDYQESDIIFEGFYRATTGAQIEFSVGINFALMNKNITSINFYGASANDTVVAAGWTDSASGAYLISTIKTQTDSQKDYFLNTEYNFWRLQNNPVLSTPYFGHNYPQVNSGVLQLAIDSGLSTLSNSINHEPDKNRSYPTPKFAAKFGSEEGETMVINNGDTNLMIANRNGSGTLEDDNFVDVRVDNSGNRLKITTSGTGEILGLEILEGIIHVLRSNQCEQYDLQGVFIRQFKIDCVSKNSIHTTPYGVVFAGKSGIYLIPLGGGQIVPINTTWDDYYNGSEYVTGTTPYVTDAYRTAIVGGYDETYQESWFNIQVNTESSSEYIQFRYKYDTNQWRQRQLNTTAVVKNFANSLNNKTFYIVTGSSILLYPNNTGTYPFQDDVRINGAGTEISQSKSVLLDATINIAEFDDEVRTKVLDSFKLDFTGSTTDTYGLMTIELYAGNEETPFDTQYVRVDELMDWRKVERRGIIPRLRIRIYHEDSTNFGAFDLKKILLGFVDRRKLGNL